MIPVTVWERKIAGKWYHNHIKDGHADLMHGPKPRCGYQESMWCHVPRAEWFGAHAYLDADNRLVFA